MHRLDQRFQGLGIGLRHVSPDHNAELLLNSYFQRAAMARKLDWNIPILRVADGSVSATHIKTWLNFHFNAEYACIASCVQTIAAACRNGEIELDPWDIVAWLGNLPAPDAQAIRQVLQQAQFIPATGKLTVVTMVATQNSAISFRLSWSNIAFSRASPHFLLRYFLHKDKHAAAEQLFQQTAENAMPKQVLWIEATRAILPMDNASDTANALVLLRKLIQGYREFMQQSEVQPVLFCEMPVWFANMANLKKFGDFPLLHGVDLLRVV